MSTARGQRRRQMAWFLASFALLLTTPAEQTTDLRVVDLDERPVDVWPATSGKPVAFIFVRTDCPIGDRYAPELRRLQQDYDKKVDFYLVYADPDETPAAIRTHVKEFGHTAPVLRDPFHDLVTLVGASVTPEVAVLLAPDRSIYRGRIDNRFVDYGKSRPEATEHDLRDVLDQLLTGSTPPFSSTEAIGCFITPLDEH